MKRKRSSSPVQTTALIAKRLGALLPIQRQACAAAGAPFAAPDYSKVAWLGPGVAEGSPRVLGVRYPETDIMCGWSFTEEGRPRPDPTELRFEPLRNVVLLRPDLMSFVALPTGWSFSTYGDGTWYAHSPKDQLEDWIENFVERGENSRDDALAIAVLIEGSLVGTALADRVPEPLREWAATGGSPHEVAGLLRWAAEWLRDSGLR